MASTPLAHDAPKRSASFWGSPASGFGRSRRVRSRSFSPNSVIRQARNRWDSTTHEKRLLSIPAGVERAARFTRHRWVRAITIIDVPSIEIIDGMPLV